jgi:hypothetical protein
MICIAITLSGAAAATTILLHQAITIAQKHNFVLFVGSVVSKTK